MQARIPPSRPDASHVVDKMLRNVWNVGYITMMLPEACVIQVVRHPLDTALSCYAQPFEGRGTPWAWDLQGGCVHNMVQTFHRWESSCPIPFLLGYAQWQLGRFLAQPHQ